MNLTVLLLVYLDGIGYPGPMDADPAWHDDVAMPALLRAARTTYGSAIRSALEEVGCADVPRNGVFVIGAIARTGSPLGEIIAALGVSKQAAGQLVDTLVLRGYLHRAPDPDDRRRMTVSLTERGRTAAAAGRAAVERIDGQLADRVGAEHGAHTRATLAALIGLGRDGA
jgi:DNA-binding MarR family transcriptional regulator